MNLEVVSVESPSLVPSQPSGQDELRRKAAFGTLRIYALHLTRYAFVG